MTKYTPNNNWPIAEETDVVKQYPLTVDEPFKMALDIMVPPGSMVLWGLTVPPDGWLICDGQAVSRTTYANLFATINTVFGTGDGSTTFNVPNFLGRVPVGRDAAQSEFSGIGETGGEKKHLLTIAELPSHTHTSPGQNQLVDNGGGPAFAYSPPSTATTSATGGDDPFNILQPYITMSFIIKF